MANIENNPEKNDVQKSHFADDQELKAKVYDAIEEQLEKSSEKAFDSEGFKSRQDTAMKRDKADDTTWNHGEGQQGWNRGVYGDGSTYGMGAKKGEVNVTVNRVKGSKATNGFFEKNLSFGGKKMVVEIHVDVDPDAKSLEMTYKTTEQSAFRGFHDKKGPFMIDDKLYFKLEDMGDFKKELKKKFDDYAEKEANYFIKTKLGIEDRIEKSINSMVESNMNKLSLKDILAGDFDETLNKIMESTKKDKEEKEVEPNHPEVKDANSPGNLLFDDKEDDEDTVDEVTASAGGAGAGAYQTPGAFAKGGDFDDEMGTSPEKKTMNESGDRYVELQKKFEDTPYAKKEKKRTLRREGTPDGWTTVELDADGYAPKGMDKNHAMGLHGVEVNSDEENKLAAEPPRGRAGMKGKKSKGLSESFDPSKRKFITESEHEDKGINKRYIITHKPTKEEEHNRWASLSNFEKNSTIRLAESCGAPVEDGKASKAVTREEGEEMNKKEFMQRNSGVDAGDTVDGKEVIVVAKPDSLSGAEFKVFKDDYLNENKAFILDMNTGNLVNNPNYKTKEVKEHTEAAPLNESVEPKVEESKIPNTAYYFNAELGRLVRNPNFKAE